MIVLLVRFYFKNGFQQVNDEYIGFMTIKELFDIHFVITQKCESFWLYLLLSKSNSCMCLYVRKAANKTIFIEKFPERQTELNNYW